MRRAGAVKSPSPFPKLKAKGSRVLQHASNASLPPRLAGLCWSATCSRSCLRSSRCRASRSRQVGLQRGEGFLQAELGKSFLPTWGCRLPTGMCRSAFPRSSTRLPSEPPRLHPRARTVCFLPADAFATFKDLLTRHKPLVAAFLQENYDDVRGGGVGLDWERHGRPVEPWSAGFPPPWPQHAPGKPCRGPGVASSPAAGGLRLLSLFLLRHDIPLLHTPLSRSFSRSWTSC